MKHPDLTRYLYQFNPNDVLDALQDCKFTNVKLPEVEASTIQAFFDTDNLQLTSQRIGTIHSIPLFDVIQRGFGRLSIDLIKSSFAGNKKVIALTNCHEFERELIPSSSLVINGSTNCLLSRLTNTVSVMNGTEYLLQVAFPQISSGQFSGDNLITFTKSVFEKCHITMLHSNSMKQLTDAIAKLPFVPTGSSNLEAPCRLFDPRDFMLKQLFSDQSKFPGPDFSSYIPVLLRCGLKSIDGVVAKDIMQIISSAQAGPRTTPVSCSLEYSKLVAAMSFLKKYPHILEETHAVLGRKFYEILIERTQKFSCLPVVYSCPLHYPSCLKWRGSLYNKCVASASCNSLVAISQDIKSSPLPLIIGSQAIL